MMDEKFCYACHNGICGFYHPKLNPNKVQRLKCPISKYTTDEKWIQRHCLFEKEYRVFAYEPHRKMAIINNDWERLQRIDDYINCLTNVSPLKKRR